MSSLKDPGISIEWISLTSCEVKDVQIAASLRYALAITDFSRRVSDDGKRLILAVGFDIMSGIENPPCKFNCAFAAAYSRTSDGMGWEDFKDHVAMAHLVPYLREFVSNVTARLPLAQLVLPPINTRRLLEEHKQRQQAARQPDAPAQSPAAEDRTRSRRP